MEPARVRITNVFYCACYIPTAFFVPDDRSDLITFIVLQCVYWVENNVV